MRFSGLVRVGILGILVTMFVSGLVAYYAPEAKAQAEIAGFSAPKWLLWTAGLSVGSVAYFSAVFWLLGLMKKGENGATERLDFSHGIRALLGAPFVVAFFPLILLGGAVAAISNHPGEIRERIRLICMRRPRPEYDRATTCPECGGEARNLPSAGVVNCKACGMVST